MGWRHDSSDDSVVLVAGSVIKHWKRIVVQYDERERLGRALWREELRSMPECRACLGRG